MMFSGYTIDWLWLIDWLIHWLIDSLIYLFIALTTEYILLISTLILHRHITGMNILQNYLVPDDLFWSRIADILSENQS